MSFFKRQVPIFLTGFVGAIMLAEYYFPLVPARIVATEIQRWAVILSAFAVFTSTFQLLRFHGRKVIERAAGQWYISGWMIAIMLFMVAIGVAYSVRHPIYVWLFNNVYYTLSASTNSLMGFFIASAAYRAFKARSIEGGVLLVSALIVAFTNVPIGMLLWRDFPTVGNWIRNVVNTAAFRGILIGAAVGTVVLGIRRLIGRSGGYA
jgi:hypothetical protein